MDDLKMVIGALEQCLKMPRCQDCSWESCNRIDCPRAELPMDLTYYALDILKAQEPRMMTLEEVLTTDKPFFIEKPSNEDGDKEWSGWGVVDTEDREAGTIMFAVIGKSQRLLCDVETMGEYFRCWTARPTAGAEGSGEVR